MELKDLPYEMVYEICIFCDRRTQEGLRGKHEYIDNYIDRRPINLSMLNIRRMMLKPLFSSLFFTVPYRGKGARLKISGHRAFRYRFESIDIDIYGKRIK